MQIFILSWEYPPYIAGGLGQHVAELSPALVAQGIEVHILTPVPTHHETSCTNEAGVNVHRVATMLEASSDIHHQAVMANQILVNYANTLPRQDNSIIHAHDWLMSFAATTLQREWQCPLIATVHATERGRVRGYVSSHLQLAIEKAEYELIIAATQIIVCSHSMFREVQAFFRTPVEKLNIIPNGVNVASLSNGFPPNMSDFRANYVTRDELLVFSIARLVYEKGIHLIIQAAPRILAELPNTRFVIAGRGPEGENLHQQAQILGVADYIHFVGFISDRERNGLFKVADCAIFPSLYEPFGIVALEAMALGCPVIVSDIGGLAETVEHGKTGLTIYANDDHSAGWGILNMLKNPTEAKQYTLHAHKAIETVFNWSRIARLTHEVYDKVIGSG